MPYAVQREGAPDGRDRPSRHAPAPRPRTGGVFSSTAAGALRSHRPGRPARAGDRAMTTTLPAPVDETAPRTAADHVAYGLALWTLEGESCGRDELAMRLYRFADDVATGGRLWAGTVEYARELAEVGRRGAVSRSFA